MSQLSEAKVAEIAAIMRPKPPSEVPEGSRINVHAAVSRFAVLYEKIRNAVDYQDDHLLRKSAILRILKRQLLLEGDSLVIASNLVRELIAARYLANGTLSDNLISQAANVIRKYQAVRQSHFAPDHQTWLLGIVAAELEEVFDDNVQQKALLNFLYESLGNRIVVKGAAMDDLERRLQVYIACYRALFKVDDDILGYKLVRAFHSAWIYPQEWIARPEAMALQMVGVEMKVRGQLRHPWGLKFSVAVKPWAIALSILRRALQENPKDIERLLHNPEALRSTVGQIAERRYKEAKGKLRRGTVRAMIYLFLTKMILALALEIPIENFLYSSFNKVSLLINVLFPPVLMFFVGSLIRVPGKANTERLQRSVEELLSTEGPSGREIKISRKRSLFARFFLQLVYLLTFVLVFGAVYQGLDRIGFTWISKIIFIMFLCLVSFFAFRLRNSARESVVVEGPDKFSGVIFDFFSLPILRVGRILSTSISRLNFFVFFFDFIIEAPFKIFLNVLEEWFTYMKEKKEELQ